MSAGGMDCAEVRERLLVAAPAELDDPRGALAEHLSRCDACAEKRAAVAGASRDLAGSLAALEGRFDEERALRIALEGRGHPSSEAGATDGSRPGTAGARRASRWGWIALPLAAAAAFLIAVRGPEAPAPGPFEPSAAWTLAARAAPQPFSVEPAPGARVAVFQTRDPTIRVVWLYGSRAAPDEE